MGQAVKYAGRLFTWPGVALTGGQPSRCTCSPAPGKHSFLPRRQRQISTAQMSTAGVPVAPTAALGGGSPDRTGGVLRSCGGTELAERG